MFPNRQSLLSALLFILPIAACQAASWLDDPLRSEASAPAWFACPALPPAASLSLYTAASQALCHHPQTREAWAQVQAQQAQLGGARAAYLPTLNATLQSAREHARTQTPSMPYLDTDSHSRYRSDTLSLNWRLYDFGAREAGRDNARALLDAAQAGEDVAMQKVLAATAQDYYAAVAAQAGWQAARETQAAAEQSASAAARRVQAGVAAISDQLQAQTAAAQARYALAKAAGALRNAEGALALDMGLPPDSPLTLPPASALDPSAAETMRPAAELLAAAQREHPSLQAARAQVAASRAKETQVRAQGWPVLSLVARASHNTQPESLGTGLPQVGARSQDRYVGIQVDIPLFEGFGRHYQARQAAAETAERQSQLEDAQMQVAHEVWTRYQALETASANTRITRELLDSAQAAFAAGKARYEKGAGNILELLNVQTELAKAREQRVEALTDWLSARLQLAASVGRLGLESMR
ncbi:TolC family protein [Chromobacterium alticapitis]|nr:TolC family protein [Chromobacterium alticapitis]